MVNQWTQRMTNYSSFSHASSIYQPGNWFICIVFYEHAFKTGPVVISNCNKQRLRLLGYSFVARFYYQTGNASIVSWKTKFRSKARSVRKVRILPACEWEREKSECLDRRQTKDREEMSYRAGSDVGTMRMSCQLQTHEPGCGAQTVAGGACVAAEDAKVPVSRR